jgi:hypothetical protein
VAERLWSPAAINDIEDFYRRLRLVLELPPYRVAAVQQSRLRDLGLSDGQISTAVYLEPVKWYARLLGEEALQARLQGSEMPQARPYDAGTPLNRLVDFISPESLAARELMMLDPPQLVKLAREWQKLDDQTWPQDVRDAIAGLRDAGVLLVELLGEAPREVQAERYAQSIARLRDIYQPRGEYMVAVVPWLLRWLHAWYGGER